MTENNGREILRGFLRVLAGASQIAIDRGPDSGVIDFTDTIEKALQSLCDLISENELINTIYKTYRIINEKKAKGEKFIIFESELATAIEKYIDGKIKGGKG